MDSATIDVQPKKGKDKFFFSGGWLPTTPLTFTFIRILRRSSSPWRIVVERQAAIAVRSIGVVFALADAGTGSV